MRPLLSILCVAGFLTACNAATAVTPPGSVSQSSHRDSTWHLYVANSNGTISIYDPGGTIAVETISKGVGHAEKMLFSKAGGLYVLNCGVCGYYDEGNITVYGALRHSLLRTITESLDGPADIALDSASNLYVANRLGNTVTVYAPGSTKVARTIRRGISYPHSLAIDSSNRLYVANCPGPCGSSRGTVTVYDGSTGDLLETIPSLHFIEPIVVGPNGNLYAQEWGETVTDSDVAVFPWGHLKPTREMPSLIALALAVNAAGDTYIANCFTRCNYYSIGGSVQEYGPNGSRIRNLIVPEDVPNGLALAPDGSVYVSLEDSEVNGYAPGKSKPFVRIKRDVYFPNGLAIGP